MEKVKGVFSKIGSGIKSHLKLIIAIIAIVVVAIVALSFVGGAEQRAVKKYISAVNSYEKDKFMKAIDEKGLIAWDKTNIEEIEDFTDNLDDVDDDNVDSLKDKVKDNLKDLKEGKVKYKLLKVVNVATAKDNKDIKRVYIKYKATRKATDDDKDDAKDSDYWKGLKATNESITGYTTIYLYKNKVISSPFVSTYVASSDYDFDFDY